MPFVALLAFAAAPLLPRGERDLASNGLSRAVAIFDALDANRDGRLDRAEQRRIGGVSAEELSAADLDRDGVLERGEFLGLHRRMLRREGQCAARDLELAVARDLALRRARGILAAEAERGLTDTRQRTASALSDRLASRGGGSTQADEDVARAFARFERRVLDDEGLDDAAARLVAAFRGAPIVLAPAAEHEADEPDPEELVRALLADRARGGRRAVALLSELRRTLGIDPDGMRRVPSDPRAHAGSERGEAVVSTLEQAVAARRSTTALLRELRALLADSVLGSAAIDDCEAALARDRATSAHFDRLRAALRVH